MRKFMMTTAIVAATSLAAGAQTTTGTATGTAATGTAATAGATQMDQRLAPAFLVSDFTGKNLYTLDAEEARTLRDQRVGMGTYRDPAMTGTATGTAATGTAATTGTAPVAGTTAPAAGTATTGTTATATQPGATTGTHPYQAQAQHGGWDRARLRWETGDTFTAGRDRWNNVGDISDVVMTADGDIRGILIDVGGFLGIGARTVMVDIDELHFVRDGDATGATGGWFDDTADDFFIVAAMSEAELEALPEFDTAMLRQGMETRRYQPTHAAEGVATDATMTQPGMAADTTVQQQPATTQPATTTAQQQPATTQPATTEQTIVVRTEAPQGYQPMAVEQLTADNLMGANVWDGQNQQIGQVEDLILAADGAQIEALVLDVGGFIGIGTHRVALSLQEVDIFWGDAQQDVRVQVPMTQEQLEQMPEHQG